jgi:cobalt-zinc-cadmium efflux system protein
MEFYSHLEESLLKEKIIKKALFVSFAVLFIEVTFGIISNSLALLSDALHVFTDVFSALIALLAIKISQKTCSERFSLGYHRFEVMAAFSNGLLLLVAVALIFREAYLRLGGVEINAHYMLPAAVAGFVGNLYVLRLLHDTHDINIRGVYMHALSDALCSLAVIAGGVAIVITGYSAFDSAIGVLIGIFVLQSAVKLIRDSSYLLLQGVPPDLNIDEIRSLILSFPDVSDVHSLHVYALCSNVRVLNAHIVVGDLKLSKVEKIRKEIEKELTDRFRLAVTTLQFECSSCR